MEDADILLRHPVPRHRLNVSEFHQLAEAGILGADDRIELLDGQLVDMSPIGPRHALAVNALMYSLIPSTAGRAVVGVQQPLVLDDGSDHSPTLPWSGRIGGDTPARTSLAE